MSVSYSQVRVSCAYGVPHGVLSLRESRENMVCFNKIECFTMEKNSKGFGVNFVGESFLKLDTIRWEGAVACAWLAAAYFEFGVGPLATE